MRRELPRYVYEDADRHGNIRTYAWFKGGRKIRIHAKHATVEFFQECRAAIDILRGERAGAPRPSDGKPKQIDPNSIRALVIRYYGTGEFKMLDPRTRHVRRLVLDRFCREHGAKPAAGLQQQHVKAIRDRMADRPSAANSLVQSLRQVFAHTGFASNPAAAVKFLKVAGEGHHSWTLAEAEQFEARHPVGTRARLALALLLYTGQRRSDVVRLGRQFETDGGLEFTQFKNRVRKPKRLWIPIIDELRTIIDAIPSGHMTYLVTHFGKPFTGNGFGNRFRKWCDEAGLKNCSAHGLRKAAGARLAELGCSEHEIASILGHDTLKEVVRYTKAAKQKTLAKAAGRRLSQGQTENESFPLYKQVQAGGKNLATK